jgi:ribosomal-protein-alanine N-acetyltransferase
VIRRAVLADVPALATIHAAAFDPAWETGAISVLMTAEGGLALLAEGGFILIRTVAGEAEVLTLAVEPAARRQGIGKALVQAAVEAAQAAAEAIFLEVAADNTAALHLYAACGFEPVGRRAGYYRRAGAEMDALVLRKTLNVPDA